MASNPSKRRSTSITLHYDISSALLAAGILPLLPPKKLRRMPHLFCRVLELPLHSESPVQIQESLHCFTFATSLPGLVPENVCAEIIEILPGVTKIVIGGADRVRAVLDELEIPLWRFRLPPCCLPEAASATYDDGVLIVTVPKAPAANSERSSDINLEGAVVERASLQSDSGCHNIAAEVRSEPDRTGLSGVSATERDSIIPASLGGVEAVGSTIEDVGDDIHAKVPSDGFEKDASTVHLAVHKDSEAGVVQGHVIAEVTSLHLGASGDEEGFGRSISVQ